MQFLYIPAYLLHWRRPPHRTLVLLRPWSSEKLLKDCEKNNIIQKITQPQQLTTCSFLAPGFWFAMLLRFGGGGGRCWFGSIGGLIIIGRTWFCCILGGLKNS